MVTCHSGGCEWGQRSGTVIFEPVDSGSDPDALSILFPPPPPTTALRRSAE
jgi:hypothetical protein